MKNFLQTTLIATAAAAMLAGAAHAAAPMVKTPAPGFYRIMVGDIEVTPINDGTVDLPMDQLLHQKPELTRSTLTGAGSTLTASMLRDIERGARTEGEHIIGDLLRRGRWFTADTVLLPVAFAQMQAHEARCAREAAETAQSRRRVA